MKAHLHLLALDRLIYARIGRSAEYDRRVAFARASEAPYHRAYEIVAAEGAEKLVAELRAGRR